MGLYLLGSGRATVLYPRFTARCFAARFGHGEIARRDTVLELEQRVKEEDQPLLSLSARECVSGSESGEQLYEEFGAAKLDGVDFQSAPADEA